MSWEKGGKPRGGKTHGGKAKTAVEREIGGRGGTSGGQQGRTWVRHSREERNQLREEQREGEQGTLWGPTTELFCSEMMAKSSGDTSCKGRERQ